jgi:hypothetical protein
MADQQVGLRLRRHRRIVDINALVPALQPLVPRPPGGQGPARTPEPPAGAVGTAAGALDGYRIRFGLCSRALCRAAGKVSNSSWGYSTRFRPTLSAMAVGRRLKHQSQRPIAPVLMNR